MSARTIRTEGRDKYKEGKPDRYRQTGRKKLQEKCRFVMIVESTDWFVRRLVVVAMNQRAKHAQATEKQ